MTRRALFASFLQGAMMQVDACGSLPSLEDFAQDSLRPEPMERDLEQAVPWKEAQSFIVRDRRVNPSCVFTGRSVALEDLGRVMAHEFGRMLRLTAARFCHSDDRGIAECRRHDIWSRMRLMSKYIGYHHDQPDWIWQDTTYGTFDSGAMKAGDLLTLKNFDNDGSDGELARARRSAGNLNAQTGL
jgi:hypothetical protein